VTAILVQDAGGTPDDVVDEDLGLENGADSC